MRLGAIDIGSNAARLLITEVNDTNKNNIQFNKLNLIRVPLRLGFDVFESGVISEARIEMFVSTMQAYVQLMKAYGVEHYKATATSAMRDAKNAKEIVARVAKETGIKIEIISGSDEAAYIQDSHVAEKMDDSRNYLYIDVGGGSTELTLFSKGKIAFKQSFNIGTIRLLKGMISNYEWEDMKETIKQQLKNYPKTVAIGSGGNINKVFSISKRKDGKSLPLELLKDYFKELNSVPLAERIEKYKMREDRADVIVPALQIYINVMRWADADEIFVPKIGLADGITQHIYYELKEKNL